MKISQGKFSFLKFSPWIFQNFNNCNAYFWKITPNVRTFPNSKILFRPHVKNGPPNFCWTPYRKIFINYKILLCKRLCYIMFKPQSKILVKFSRFWGAATHRADCRSPVWTNIFDSFQNKFMAFGLLI